MASICLSTAYPTAKLLPLASPPASSSKAYGSSPMSRGCACSVVLARVCCHPRLIYSRSRRLKRQVVRMAPEEEQLTQRNPVDFPLEWERPKPGRRPDIFPRFSPMKTPLPPPLPCDPPEEEEEDEEEEEKKKEGEEEEEKEKEGEEETPERKEI
ncbi:tRNA 2-thiocytidine biosynthesis TtcA [Tripterygium wilfordii]|uniref:tRNA 2-thiocytidine biosynthesis TtcA n=1 Tax=Tripterygium wilfordii TaxID=458696 RepID=A0A7J7DQG7_TRIWF|nr:coiled-coil domain-containing protein 9 [Tripterygium wilfordii]KAF5748595.1 tRNA 2-thiocytidine biosynthesis TtcA [Tripterygium wilfordii]